MVWGETDKTASHSATQTLRAYFPRTSVCSRLFKSADSQKGGGGLLPGAFFPHLCRVHGFQVHVRRRPGLVQLPLYGIFCFCSVWSSLLIASRCRPVSFCLSTWSHFPTTKGISSTFRGYHARVGYCFGKLRADQDWVTSRRRNDVYVDLGF